MAWARQMAGPLGRDLVVAPNAATRPATFHFALFILHSSRVARARRKDDDRIDISFVAQRADECYIFRTDMPELHEQDVPRLLDYLVGQRHFL